MPHVVQENKIQIVFMLNFNLFMLWLVVAMAHPDGVSKATCSMDVKVGDVL